MKTPIKASAFSIFLILAISCKKEKETTIAAINWSSAQNYYLKNIQTSIDYLDSLKKEGFDGTKSKQYFTLAREAFKKSEPYASYLNPEVGHRANGPALPIYKDDNGKVLNPVGFQKIEESIYEQETSKTDFEQELYVTKGMLYVLKKGIEKRELNAQRFFIATHQQLFRIVSLAISGFDTPVSHLGINESKISLEGLKTVYQNTIQPIIQNKNKSLDIDFLNSISKAVKFIEQNDNFDTFDRFTFTRDYMNPITRNWVNIRKTSNLWDPVNTEPFNFDAPTFFENNSFNLNFFTPATNRNPTDKQIALGEKLFSDPKLSSNGTMACITCHVPNKGYADGMKVNLDNNGKPLQRNTPTLINTAFQQSFFLDGRASSLIDQISLVFTNDKEFNTNVHEFSDIILKDSTYVDLFKDAYGRISKNNKDVIKAISSYISTLNSFNSKFDKNIRGEENTFTNEERQGYNLFMGKALCATCHFIPLTNGTVPPFFNETEKEVIGVPKTSDNKEFDNDLGFYWKYKEDLHKGMFKTPTIRNVEKTAPYMHNGVYQTLEEVVDFYNKGGGNGLGFELEHQTLPFEALNLSDEEQKNIVAFMKTLTESHTPKNPQHKK
ncbi:Cytochrome c551 peroxidase precursor [Mariniflexile rhizosphaerae]|uniref:cytochrome-c peroxidase n=1 Tax=unclassified Mariniflexile TaxID=2643887 RepID=UPI000CC13F00|nr:cytochrome c peroxidase [Mariniflexile sp. TRM1-10]AXP83051.1 Cytochrome c551 peroxidase precursor [Mariniflexile sp. TRM1-10]PLB19723.1 MAG: Di-heme cytochrome c peroxidase [Flavobacteriaceae bacterium FS1-H7996/R]